MPVPDSAASPLTVLLVEDDDVDAMGVERMFKRVSSPHQVELHRAKDGEMGLAELEVLVRMGKRKVIVLLDINMPRMNGHEFLEKLRQNRSLRSTPVFILTTSVDPSDVELAYEHYVAGYFEKATRFPGDDSIARFLQLYADMVILPRLSADAGLSA